MADAHQPSMRTFTLLFICHLVNHEYQGKLGPAKIDKCAARASKFQGQLQDTRVRPQDVIGRQNVVDGRPAGVRVFPAEIIDGVGQGVHTAVLADIGCAKA